MNKTNTLGPLAQLEQMIRMNEKGVWLRLADESDIQRLSGVVEPEPIKQRLFNWNLVAVDLEVPEGQIPDDGVAQSITMRKHLYLLGFDAEFVPWCTSSVVCIDMDSSTVLTRSGSRYSLWGERNESEIELRLVEHLGDTFVQWGLGERFGLVFPVWLQ